MTAPTGGTPWGTLADWRGTLQKAAAALAENPHDHEAAEWLVRARNQLKGLIAEQDAGFQATSAAEARTARDPGKLGALGLGFSQAATLGFGDELAGLVAMAVRQPGQTRGDAYREQVDETRTATQGARESHPGYYWTGEAAGTLPFLAGAAITKAPAVTSTVGRALLRVAAGAGKGAALVGTEAAGRENGTLAERAKAGLAAAPYGAAAGAGAALLPYAVPVAANRLLVRPLKAAANAAREVVERTAGKAPSTLPRIAADILPAAAPLGLLGAEAPAAPPRGPHISTVSSAKLRELLGALDRRPGAAPDGLRDAIVAELDRRKRGRK